MADCMLKISFLPFSSQHRWQHHHTYNTFLVENLFLMYVHIRKNMSSGGVKAGLDGSLPEVTQSPFTCNIMSLQLYTLVCYG